MKSLAQYINESLSNREKVEQLSNKSLLDRYASNNDERREDSEK